MNQMHLEQTSNKLFQLFVWLFVIVCFMFDYVTNCT